MLVLSGAVLGSPAGAGAAPVGVPGEDQVVTCHGLAVTLRGTAGPDHLTGTPGRDVIAAGAGDDVVNGGGGDDVICGGSGNDHLTGGAGDDRIQGGTGDDVLRGGGGHDTMIGGTGNDTCTGGSASALGCETEDCLLCWQPVPLPEVGQRAALSDVAVGSGSDAWAVGGFQDDAFAGHAVIERYTPQGWQLEHAPVLAVVITLTAVTVASNGDVWAVGASVAAVPDSGGVPLLLLRRGGVWSPQPPPVADGVLTGVSVAPTGEVWVLGQGGSGSFVARWDGASWAVLPGLPGDDLTGLVAVGSDEVWVAGVHNRDFPNFLQVGQALHWKGGRWTARPVGPPSTDEFAAVSTSHLAVLPGREVRVLGSSGDFRGGFRQGFLAAPGALGESRALSRVDPVAAAADGNGRTFVMGKTATGDYSSSGPPQPAAALSTGSSLVRFPLDPVGDAAVLSGVAMTSGGAGWAVGWYLDATGQHALALRHAYSGG